LTTSGTSLDAKILGTPEHIAPEIFKNDIITAQTDNYSLGKSIRFALESFPEDKTTLYGRPLPERSRLEAFLDDLTAENPVNRPYSILDCLFQHQLIEKTIYVQAKKKVLSLLLLSSFRRLKSTINPYGTGWLVDFLQKENRIFGFHQDLIDDLEGAYAQRPLAVLQIFKKLVTATEIENYGDFWQFNFSDDILGKIFLTLDELNGKKPVLSGSVENKPLKRYIYLKQQLSSESDKRKTKDRHDWQAFEKLGRLALELNRSVEAIDHFRQALDLIPDRLNLEKVQLIYQLVIQSTIVARHQEAQELIDLGTETARAIHAEKEELEFQNQRAYLLATAGQQAKAEKLLQSIIEKASDLGLAVLVAKAYYNLFYIEYIRGNFGEAEELGLKCIKLTRKAKDDTFLLTAYTGMAGLYTELAEYDKAINMSNNVVKIIRKQKGKAYKLLNIYKVLVMDYTRLGLTQDSEHWLNLLLSARSVKFDKLAFLDYSIMKGWLEISKGLLHSGREVLQKAMGSVRFSENNRYAGKILFNLSEIALYQGEFAECEHYAGKALDIFSKLNDFGSYWETRLIKFLNTFYGPAGVPAPESEFLEILEKLTEHNCRHYAVYCLIQIAIHLNDNSLKRARAITQPLEKGINESPAPMFTAARLMLKYRLKKTDRDENVIRLMKDAYQELDSNGQKFLAMILCGKIGEHYRETLQQKLSRKFFTQALSLAHRLPNKQAEAGIQRQLDTVPEQDYGHDKVLKTMLGISDILRDIDNYEFALARVVQFAVNETGAERGVLLLKSEGSEDLHIRSYYNCDDEESLKDIGDFSKSVVSSVARKISPLVVSDALEDKRTKRYKSIAVHNIRSVIAMPIQDGNVFYGVLYLDHHTIPALFGDDDITLVTSLANFLSVILNVLKRFKSASVNKDQLQHELARHGLSEMFITRNEGLMEMLEQLSQLAQTNASILILGETGTGKEIISRLIHSLSQRAEGPFVKMNCAAIADTLIESELFGIDDKIATDVKAREGKFEAADTGTLFLDEIGDMPLNIQTKVLGVLEYREYQRVGSNRTNYTDARFLYATNKNLKKMISEGKFSRDLYYRIYSLILEIPPLRERPEDIEPLLGHFTRLYSPDPDQRLWFTTAAVKALTVYHWPGNVREVKNLVERLHYKRFSMPNKRVDLLDLPADIQRAGQDSHSKEHAEALEKNLIKETWKKNNWNQTKTARELGMSLAAFRRKLKKYNIRKKE
ncbi:MAG: sigma 54-interacting transcriptional regulator, partial [candidate division Zixibacteria bacterium]|nr:sigma 54-interacting transcriptional regulator [candidate division Zixibacteria bacterium]